MNINITALSTAVYCKHETIIRTGITCKKIPL